MDSIPRYRGMLLQMQIRQLIKCHYHEDRWLARPGAMMNSPGFIVPSGLQNASHGFTTTFSNFLFLLYLFNSTPSNNDPTIV